mmetsp:Transcript_5382/g.13525  ORF Transcript_5382/g.13525 Transcript_5382/m.13525 type:complete len:291 (+) Transcript_5382:66-938(+)
MKIQPMMNSRCVTQFSDLTTTAQDHVKLHANCYVSGSLMDEETASGWTYARDPDDLEAKSFKLLNPYMRQKYARSIGKNFLTEKFTVSDQANKSLTTSFSVGASKVNPVKREETVRADIQSETETRRVIRFSNVTIQEYTIQPGVNPGGFKGCPLTIGWEPISSKSVNLDVFEESRFSKRRNHKQLQLQAEQRENILKGMGYTMRSIRAGTKAANLCRRERANTINRLQSSATEERLEELRMNVRNFVTFGQTKRREQKFLVPYQNDRNSLQATKSMVLPRPRFYANTNV